MKYEVNGRACMLFIEKKNNKNTYIRVKDDGNIYVTTNYFVSKKQVLKLLDQNNDYLMKCFDRVDKKNNLNDEFYYMGNRYDIIMTPTEEVLIMDDKIYVKNLEMLQKWYKDKMLTLFKNRIDHYYELFEEKIPYPILKVRKMKTRWGVCNRKNNSVTLNSELLKYDLEKLDYVVVHELSHFVEFNHSKNFWLEVSKYCPEYKRIRKELKEGLV